MPVSVGSAPHDPFEPPVAGCSCQACHMPRYVTAEDLGLRLPVEVIAVGSDDAAKAWQAALEHAEAEVTRALVGTAPPLAECSLYGGKAPR